MSKYIFRNENQNFVSISDLGVMIFRRKLKSAADFQLRDEEVAVEALMDEIEALKNRISELENLK